MNPVEFPEPGRISWDQDRAVHPIGNRHRHTEATMSHPQGAQGAAPQGQQAQDQQAQAQAQTQQAQAQQAQSQQAQAPQQAQQGQQPGQQPQPQHAPFEDLVRRVEQQAQQRAQAQPQPQAAPGGAQPQHGLGSAIAGLAGGPGVRFVVGLAISEAESLSGVDQSSVDYLRGFNPTLADNLQRMVDLFAAARSAVA